MIFPDPVRANLFLAPELVLILGILLVFKDFNSSYNIASANPWRGLWVSMSGLFFLGAEHDDHALAFKNGHLVDLSVFLKVIGETEQQHLALFLEQD